MPTYDYRCPSNSRVVEVSHSMARTVATWGELVALAQIDPGDTPNSAPVERVISGGIGVLAESRTTTQQPAGHT
jgi:hypothetical protein